MGKHILHSWFRAALLAALLAVAGAAQGQGQAKAAASDKPYRIYAITYRGMTDIEKGFQEYFKAAKIPVDITWRDLNLDPTRLPGFIAEIRATKPDLVYTWGTSVTLGVVGTYDAVDPARHITDIPVVFTLVASPVGAKIVPDLKSSGRNVTGVSFVVPTETQFRAMASYRPFQTVGVIYTPTEKNSVALIAEMRALGKKMGFTTVERTFRLDANGKPTAEGAADLVRQIKEAKAQWLYLPPDSYLGTQAKEIIVPAAMAAELPTFAATEQLMETGALTGLVSRYYNVGQFTAYRAEQILVDKKAPKDISIETLSRFSYQIRMEVAHQLKLPPPLPMFNYAEFIAAPGL
jgi:putative tryptophan/tyrosine transport system substrate-binding protein